MSGYYSRWILHLSIGGMLMTSADCMASIGHDNEQDENLPNLNGSVNLPASADSAIQAANRLVLRPDSNVNQARVTFYDPDVNNAMEGGGLTRFSEKVNSIEDAAVNGRPVSLAADVYGKFGQQCNRRNSRCLVLIITDGFDTLFPQYRRRFPNLPPNSFLGLIEDTGSAFFGTSGKRFDLAARNRSLARAIPRIFNDHVRWVLVNNPCGQGGGGRRCDFSQSAVAPTMLALWVH